MAGLHEVQHPADRSRVVGLARVLQVERLCVEVEGKPRLGREHVERHERAQARAQGGQVGAGVGGGGAQHALHLAALVEFGLAQVVAEVEHAGGFEVDGLARRAGVVDEPGDLALGLGADRQHEAPAADRRLLVGRKSQRHGAAHLVEHGVAQLLARAHDLAAQAGEFRRGVVAHLPVVAEHAVEGALQLGRGRERRGGLGEAGVLGRAGVEVGAKLPDGFEHAPQGHEVFAGGDGVLWGDAAQGLAQVGERAKGHRVVEAERVGEFGHAGEAAAGLVGGAQRPERGEAFARLRAAGVVGEALAHGVEAELRGGGVGEKLHRVP